ncbi:hypothetical protein [Pseudoalteromonas luteoviolacea]|uniref:hypothetical protein n=1 Tax=Pseudoalteromonas luteoviolacea TaxID=43657 RepID=UPI001150CA53|nr:hypothetical protein [Pseudoalteromonas luteoviolacea]TQF68056.1 hypothetical protein FLM44_23090 [Pseudoalteromonas luteoviolacea]
MNFLLRLAVLFGCLFLASCDGDPYSDFGCIAPESHPAVAHARSLTTKQLETIYSETQKLSDTLVPESYEAQFMKPEIPETLNFLSAELIRVYRSEGPYIILVNCFDERIELRVSASGAPEKRITLSWAEPTNENPYATGSQVLWETNNDA